MAEKILAFAGSPRRQGHCWTLLDAVKKGVESKGGEFKIYDLNDAGVRGCQGCFYCRANPGCSVKDSLSPFYDEIADAAGVVFSSPIYFGSLTGQAKIGLDRLFPMLDGQSFQPRHPGKKAVTIYSQGDGNAERFAGAVNMVHGFLRTFGWELAESVVCFGTSSSGVEVPEDLTKKAFAAGRELVRHRQADSK